MRENDRSEFGARLYQARKHAQLSQVKVAQLVGMSQSAYAQAEREGNGSTFVTRLAEALGVHADWLATGRGSMLPESTEVDLSTHPDLTPIRKVRLRLQAGVAGYAVDTEEGDAEPIFFRNSWLQERGFKAHNLIAVKVRGSSMETNLYQDDTVVIHLADREPKDGEVFAVNYEGEAVIKRMKRDRGTWWISSDNTDKVRFPDKECADSSCIIVGRVIHKQSERI